MLELQYFLSDQTWRRASCSGDTEIGWSFVWFSSVPVGKFRSGHIFSLLYPFELVFHELPYHSALGNVDVWVEQRKNLKTLDMSHLCRSHFFQSMIYSRFTLRCFITAAITIPSIHLLVLGVQKQRLSSKNF